MDLGIEWDPRLAAAIRRDVMTPDVEVLACIRMVVARRLAVAHPGYEAE